jgi:Trypsin-like serine proteases, typically periplasmic, contain C-terminal PDZ domain
VNRIRTGETSAEIIYGQVGFMGVSVRDLTAAIASQLGLSVSTGALVVDVQSGSPADSAGITSNSVITKVGDAKITTSDSLGTAIKAHKPGDSASVTWIDQRGTHTSTLTLAGVNP